MPQQVTEPSTCARELVRGASTCTSTSSPTSRRAASTTWASRADFPSSGWRVSCSSRTTRPRPSGRPSCVAPCPAHALGAISLNNGVGGLNAQAVEIMARAGARIVWLPTVDAENEASEDGPKIRKQPVWRVIQDELAAAGVAAAPVRVTEEGLDGVLAVVARHDIALATGHLRRAEIVDVVAAAFAVGLSRVIVTHPDYPTQGVPVDEQHELAERGAIPSAASRRCTPARSREATFEAIRATGPERNVLDRSRSAGQPAGRGRARADGRPAARGGVHRGRGAYDGGRQHEDARRCLKP